MNNYQIELSVTRFSTLESFPGLLRRQKFLKQEIIRVPGFRDDPTHAS